MSAPSQFAKSASAGSADYYAVLGLDERYSIDRAELERRYLERSKSVHPDRFVNAPANQRVAALQESMLVNDAYKTLKDPMARAEFLLVRRGLTIGDNERLSPAFLMEVLELREELAVAKRAGDRATLRRLEAEMLAQRDAAFERVAALFGRLEQGGGQAELDSIKEQVILLRYIRRYLDEFDDLSEDDEQP